MTRSTYFDLGRSADARPGSESRYAQRFQCGNVVKRLIGTRMLFNPKSKPRPENHSLSGEPVARNFCAASTGRSGFERNGEGQN